MGIYGAGRSRRINLRSRFLSCCAQRFKICLLYCRNIFRISPYRSLAGRGTFRVLLKLLEEQFVSLLWKAKPDPERMKTHEKIL